MRKTQLASEPGQGVDALLWRVALGSIVAVFFAANPASSATYADCKAHAINMSGDARQKFMNFMLGRHRREDTELRQRQTLWQLLHREG